MKLIEALQIAQQPRSRDQRPFVVWLGCGFTPLHLLTFLRAHLCLALPGRRVEVRTGLYGDLGGTLEQLAGSEGDGAAVALEWEDLDQRLGVRHLGGWEPAVLGDILAEAGQRLARLGQALEAVAAKMPVGLSLPTLPLPPASFTPTSEAGTFEVRLREMTARLATQLADRPGVGLVSPDELDRLSPPGARYNLRSELANGFPYHLAHADALASLLAKLVAPPAPKKGLITDLDETLWRGILGEDGVEGVAWDLDHHAQPHGLYQQMLRSLAETGVLIGVATKNNAALVEELLQRRGDLLVRAADFYPLEVNWGPKSSSVSRILEAWNIAADSVVFVDDSPMELDEVQRAHPGLECLRFPKEDPEAVYRLCWHLRDLFGKRAIREEDRLRSASLRQAAPLEGLLASTRSLDEFLRAAEARVSFSWSKDPLDPRSLELVNKTNQFNLNGRRYAEAEWRAWVRRPETYVLLAQYRDKYGALGKIAVLAGRQEGGTATVETWVMSCRAFSRRIEHHCLKELFERLGVERLRLEFAPTERNGPARELLAAFLDAPPEGPVVLSRERFQERCPALYHTKEP
jgi:FkbH-like protein